MKPVHATKTIRRKIRTALNIRPGNGKTEEMLLEAVNELLNGGVTLQELRDGMEFNLQENFIRSKYDNEAEWTEWFITRTGIEQENIK